MLLAGLLLFSSGLLDVKPPPIFADVSIGREGPYRFLVDTGDQTSLIDPKLAAGLNLKPAFRVAVISQNSTRLLPALKLDTLRIGQKPLHESELVIADLAEARRLDPSVRGVLGWNALAGLDFTLLPGDRRLDLTAGRPAGEAVPLYRVEDRIAVAARMGRETLTLILDSGANHVVLFRTPEAMAKTRCEQASMPVFPRMKQQTLAMQNRAMRKYAARRGWSIAVHKSAKLIPGRQSENCAKFLETARRRTGGKSRSAREWTGSSGSGVATTNRFSFCQASSGIWRSFRPVFEPFLTA